MKEKFPVLNHMRIEPEHAGRIVLARTVLHNVACIVERHDRLPHLVLEEQLEHQEVDYNPEEAADENDDEPTGAANKLNALLHHFQL